MAPDAFAPPTTEPGLMINEETANGVNVRLAVWVVVPYLAVIVTDCVDVTSL